MEGIGLEEGKACAYKDNDQNTDIDVALSYIDERIGNVLGHYRKDFEDGVSAETLGAKFGGYGSFLPTYQRPPSIWSHPRTPPKVQNHSMQISSHDQLVEGAPQNSTVPSNVTQSVRPRPASTNALPLPVMRTSSVGSLDKVQSSRECLSNNEPGKLPKSDKETLKVRIKMGSDNDLLAQKNAAIYRNLGLDMSPSSSSEDSPAEREGSFLDSLEKQSESSSFIIRIMTSFPIPNGVPLSPLPDSLVRFVEDKELSQSIKSGPVQEGSTSSSILGHGVALVKRGKEAPGEEKRKTGNKNGKLVEMENEKFKDPVDAYLKKENNMETSTTKELLSDALNLSIKSNKMNKVSDMADYIGKASEAIMDGAKDRIISSDIEKEEMLGSMSSQEADRTKKLNEKSSLSGKVRKDKNVGCKLRNGDGTEGYKSLPSCKEDCDLPKGMKDDRMVDPPRIKFEQKAPLHLQHKMKAPQGEEQPVSGGKKKPKKNQDSDNSASRKSKESLRVSFSAPPKNKKTDGNCFPYKVKGDDKLLKDSRKVSLSHSDQIRCTKLEKKQHGNDLSKTPIKNQARDYKCEVSEKESLAFSNKSMERLGSRKSNFPSLSKGYQEGNLNETTPSTSLLPAEVAPIVIEENWVCCDRCHKWRLLPYGTNPDHLPKKWLCSMLYWLPGMNCCSFSEEETTNALNALYQVPVSASNNNQQSHPDGTASGVILADVQHHKQNAQDINLSSLPNGGQKKLGTEMVSNAAQHSSSKGLLKSAVKNQRGSVKSKSLQIGNQSSLETKSEKRSGDAKPLKIKSERKPDIERCRLSKKAKTVSKHYTDDLDSGELLRKENEIDDQKYVEFFSSKDRKGAAKNGSIVSVNKSKKKVQKTMAIEDNDNGSISGKKRKLKDWQDSQINLDNLPSSRHHTKDNRIVVEEEIRKSKYRNGKKSRESKIKEKESNASESKGKPDRKGKVTRILLSSSRADSVYGNSLHKAGKDTQNDQPLVHYNGNSISQRNTDDKISLRRDSVVGQPCMASTSNSSMISGSCKIKINLQEVKCSPVGSVCSTPLRISNQDNLTRSLPKKDGGNVGNHLCPTKPLPQSSRNGSSSEAREKLSTRISGLDAGRLKIFDSNDEQVDSHLLKYEDKVEKCLNDSNRKVNQSRYERNEDPQKKMDTVCWKDGKSTSTQFVLQNHNGEKSLNWLPSDRSDQVEVAAGKGKSLNAPLFGDGQESFRYSWSVPDSGGGGDYVVLPVDGSDGGDLSKPPLQLEKDGGHNGFHHVSSRHPTPKGPGAKEKDTSGLPANNALKEAKDLKHFADHFKISGSGLESTKLFFQAALNLLHGASLNRKSANYGEMTSTEGYTTSAKLCECCACEFERCKDMASAALAYKCVEVAYMRVIHSNDAIASKDLNELQMGLQKASPVVSASSSASDVDIEATVRKMDIAKDVAFPQPIGNLVIAARNRSNFVRLLDFAQDVSFAMEASRKSQIAFAAANVVLAEKGNIEAISSVKRVLDISFHDLDGLLQLIHLAMETLNR